MDSRAGRPLRCQLAVRMCFHLISISDFAVAQDCVVVHEALVGCVVCNSTRRQQLLCCYAAALAKDGLATPLLPRIIFSCW